MKDSKELTGNRSIIIALRDEAKGGFENIKPQFEKLESGYMAIIDEGQRTSLRKRRKSTLNPSMIKPKVSKVVRDVMRSFFGLDELAHIQPETKDNENDNKTADVLTEEIKEFSRDTNLYSTIKPSVRNALVYGTSCTKVYWSVVDNTVKVEHIKLGKVYLDPHAPNTHSIKYLVHRIDNMTIGELKNKFPKADIDWSTVEQTYGFAQNSEIGDYLRVSVHEVYRLIRKQWHVSTLVDDNFVREDVKLKDGLPFIISSIDEQFELMDEASVMSYGDSFISPLLPIQTEYIIRRNQQIDAIDAQLNQRFIVQKNSGVSEEELSSNRKRITIDTMQNIRELPAPRIDQAIFDTDKLEAEAQDISGISKMSQGLNDKKNLNQTATGISILTQEGSSVIDDINRAFNETLFRPLFNRIITLIYKYKTSDRFAQIDRNQKMRQKVIIDVGIGSTNKEIQSNALDGAYQSVSGAIATFASFQDREKVAKYSMVLDRLLEEKIKLLGFNSILEDIEKQEEEQESLQLEQQSQNPQIQQGVQL